MGHAALRHLVVVVPGFGGSVLRDSEGTARWGPAFSHIARGMVWADPLSVCDHPDLTVTGVLRTVTVFPPFVLPGYDRLVQQLSASFPGARVDEALPGRPRDLRADVVLFPYDFRLGVRHAAVALQAEIEARLSGLTRAGRHRRVIVVGHSMGGLVARYWLGPLGGWPDCRALITVATPHGGVPKAADWLVNGVHIGRVELTRMTEVSRGWQSVYDLLPQYPAILPVGVGDKSSSAAIGPLDVGGIAAAGFAERAGEAARLHTEIAVAWRELAERGEAPALTAVFARGHATPNRMVLAEGRLKIAKVDPEWLPNAGWRGDGTVPAISAALPDAALHQVPERHLAMAATPAIIELLRVTDGQAAAMRQQAEPAGAWLGVSVDNVVPAGVPIPVTAEVLGGPSGARTTVFAQITGPRGTEAVRMDRSGGQWRTEIPARQPGSYSLTILAAELPSADNLSCRDVLEAVAVG